MTPALPVDARQAAKLLAKADPVLGAVIARVGAHTGEPTPGKDLFPALLRSIISQQLHGKAAEAIHGRVLKQIGRGRAGARALLSLPDEALRGAGLSANKLLALRDLAAKALDGTVPTPRAAAKLSDAELIEHLTRVRGIGPWTVHMLLIFHLGRPDVLPTGDYAIRKAFSLLYRKGRAVTPAAIERHAKRWQPYRSIASWYLWRSLDLD
ncbi:MAG: DNA-3-methyladenine glycosylase 2 family protein [Verrucomicrobium sp.]|nr:DNA-3-methyladenine glycosylase 2 family protein [Verrucomicrobium sp.]